MFHPSRACSTSPFQVFSFSCSRNHSATPCFIRRTRTVVALTPSMTAGSSVANSADPGPGQLLLQFQRVEGVPAGPLDVLADHRGEPRGRGGGLGEQVGHARRRGGCPRPRRARPWPRPRSSRSRPPDSTSQYQAVMNQPGGSQARRRGSAGSARPWGLASPGWRCGPGTRPGPARPARPPRGAAAEAASLRGVVCAGVAIGVPP